MIFLLGLIIGAFLAYMFLGRKRITSITRDEKGRIIEIVEQVV